MRQDTTKRNRRADQRVQLLVAADRELQVARCDALDLEVLGRVAGELQDFGRQVFEDRRQVDGGFGADARLLARDGAKVALYAAARELCCALVSGRALCGVDALSEGCLPARARREVGGRGQTYLEAGFGGVRLGGLRVGVALAARLAACLSCRCALAAASWRERSRGRRVPFPPGIVVEFLRGIYLSCRTIAERLG
jgi:hypothetical protein